MIYSLVDRKADSGKSYVYRMYRRSRHVCNPRSCMDTRTYVYTCTIHVQGCTHTQIYERARGSPIRQRWHSWHYLSPNLHRYSQFTIIDTLFAYVNRLFAYLCKERQREIRVLALYNWEFVMYLANSDTNIHNKIIVPPLAQYIIAYTVIQTTFILAEI